MIDKTSGNISVPGNGGVTIKSEVMDSNGNDVYAEPSMDANNNWVFIVKVPADTPIFMVFEDNGTPVKVLVVESPGEGMSKKHTSIRKIRK